MDDLRHELERERARAALPADALGRLYDKRRRRAARQRVAALAVGLSIALVLVVAAALGSAFSGDERVPVSPAPGVSFDAIAGTYETRLRANVPDVRRLGLEGGYTMRLRPSGVMVLGAPPTFEGQGSSIVFRISGNIFTTNAFTNFECPGSVGTYRWSLEAGVLTLEPLDESCVFRRVLFATRPWAEVS